MFATLARTRHTIRPTPDLSPRPSAGDGAETDLIERLRTQLRVQAAVIDAQRAELIRSASLIEPALRAAGMGLWACSLPDERIEWSEGVYDLFGLVCGTAPERSDTLALYTKESQRALTAIRGRALSEGGGFNLDAEITPPGQPHRWIRITATVERRRGQPVRLFGLKQDVTRSAASWSG